MHHEITKLHQDILFDIQRMEGILNDITEVETIKGIPSRLYKLKITVFDKLFSNSFIKKYVETDKSFIYLNYVETETAYFRNLVEQPLEKMKYFESIYRTYMDEQNAFLADIKINRKQKKNMSDLYNDKVSHCLNINGLDMDLQTYENLFSEVFENLTSFITSKELRIFVSRVFKKIIFDHFMDKRFDIGRYANEVEFLPNKGVEKNKKEIKWFNDFENLKAFEVYFNTLDKDKKVMVMANYIDNHFEENNPEQDAFMVRNPAVLKTIHEYS